MSWEVSFKEQRQQIIELWDVCFVSIIHRTQFYLLFKGDPADQIYMEVEMRRLTWLQQHLAQIGNASPAHVGDEPTISLSSRSISQQSSCIVLVLISCFCFWNDIHFLTLLLNNFNLLDCSIRALRREREFLAKRLTSRLTAEERDVLYMKWDVPLEGKQRKIQFVNKLWTNPHDARHVQESAEIVAKLVGFCEGGNMSREMFELNFSHPSDKRPWIAGWNQISNLLNL